jgi:hypothetical protein
VRNYVNEIRDAVRQELPGIDEDLLDMYSLLVLVKGKETTLEDVHDAWSVWRNLTRPDHKSLIPFSELSEEVQELDRKYTNAIVKVASR